MHSGWGLPPPSPPPLPPPLLPAAGSIRTAVSSDAVMSPAQTVSRKTQIWASATLAGAVNEATADFAFCRVTDGPLVCVHWYASFVLPGPLLWLPSRVTRAPAATDWSAPAFATRTSAGSTTWSTFTVRVSSDSPVSLLTWSRKTRSVSSATCGAWKQTIAGFSAGVSVTAGPLIWVHS